MSLWRRSLERRSSRLALPLVGSTDWCLILPCLPVVLVSCPWRDGLHILLRAAQRTLGLGELHTFGSGWSYLIRPRSLLRLCRYGCCAELRPRINPYISTAWRS